MSSSTRQVINEYLSEHDLDLPISGSVREFCRDLASDHEFTANAFRHMYYKMLDEIEEEDKEEPEAVQPKIKKRQKEVLGVDDDADYFSRDDEDEIYIFCIDCVTFSMSYREIEDMIAVYVHEGGGLTQVQVARHMWRRHRRKLTADFVRRIFRVLGVVKHNPPLAPHVIEDADPEDAAEIWHEQKLAEIETRYRAKRSKKIEQALKEERQKTLHFEDLAAEYLDNQDRKVVTIPEGDPWWKTDAEIEGHTAIVCLSDWHVGKVSEIVRDVDDFNLQIDLLRARLEDYFTVENSRPVDRLIFTVGGDILDGTQGDMHAGQLAGQWCYGREQAEIAAEALALVIEEVSQNLGIESEVYTVTGNHDRTSKKRDADPFRTVGGLTYALARSHCDNARWTICDDTIAKFSAGGTGFLLTHGDQTPKDPRRLFHGLDGCYQAVITGHYHSYSFSEDYSGSWFQVGSLCGVDDYARKIGKGASPSQLVISCREGLPPVGTPLPVV